MTLTRSIKLLGNFLYGLVFIVLIIVAGLVSFSALKFPGNYKLYTVLSGSMEPEIKTGSVVFVKPQPKYLHGDIITFTDPKSPKATVTHRIFSVQEATPGAYIITKGDANKTPDTDPRDYKNILGKVYFSIPYVGYPVNYAKTRDGLIFLVIIPITIIIYSELLTIKNEAVKLLKARKTRKLTSFEKVEVEIGEEEIKVEKWYHRLLKRIKNIFKTRSTKNK